MLLELNTFKLHLIDLEQMTSPINIGKMQELKEELISTIKNIKVDAINTYTIKKGKEELLSQEYQLASYIEILSTIKPTFQTIVDNYKHIPAQIISYKKEAARWILMANSGNISAITGDEKAHALLLKANQLSEDKARILKEIGLIKTRIQQQELLFQERKYTYLRLKREIELYIIALEYIQLTSKKNNNTSTIRRALHDFIFSIQELTLELNTLIYTQHSYTKKALYFLKNQELDENTKDRIASDLLEKGIITRDKEKLIRTYRNDIKKAYWQAIKLLDEINI